MRQYLRQKLQGSSLKWVNDGSKEDIFSSISGLISHSTEVFVLQNENGASTEIYSLLKVLIDVVVR
jgi:hypothetical protein